MQIVCKDFDVYVCETRDVMSITTRKKIERMWDGVTLMLMLTWLQGIAFGLLQRLQDLRVGRVVDLLVLLEVDAVQSKNMCPN